MKTNGQENLKSSHVFPQFEQARTVKTSQKWGGPLIAQPAVRPYTARALLKS
jgi:hypothetical protein